MEEKISLQNCGEDDVLSWRYKMWKVSDLKNRLRDLFSKYKLGQELCQKLDIDLGTKPRSITIDPNEWFSDGIDCEVLKIGAKGWQKGKVKINLQVSLEFCPDEPEIEETPEISQPESPLDDIRRMINQNS